MIANREKVADSVTEKVTQSVICRRAKLLNRRKCEASDRYARLAHNTRWSQTFLIASHIPTR
jgi:hypothetical protein